MSRPVLRHGAGMLPKEAEPERNTRNGYASHLQTRSLCHVKTDPQLPHFGMVVLRRGWMVVRISNTVNVDPLDKCRNTNMQLLHTWPASTLADPGPDHV